jgi:hypothetical protein
VDLEGAFSVEAVTKEFFENYCELFEQIHKALDHLMAKDKAVRHEFTASVTPTRDEHFRLASPLVPSSLQTGRFDPLATS